MRADKLAANTTAAKLQVSLEGALRLIVHGARSRDGKLRSKPLGSRERAVAVLELLQHHLGELGVGRSLTGPLADILEAFAEAERGRLHPLFTPKPLKGRPPAPLSQFYLMIDAVLKIDRLIAKGKPQTAAARLVASQLRSRGITINGNDPAKKLLEWRHELAKAGKGQGLGRRNNDWRWYGSIYLHYRDALKLKRSPPDSQ
jgi:hypothetical protein